MASSSKRSSSRNRGIDSETFSNKVGRPLVVLGATTPSDKYYGKYEPEITDFQCTFAESILGRDNVLIVVPEKHVGTFLDHGIPADVLFHENMADIWMRDFTTVGMKQQVMFKYRPNYMSRSTAQYIQSRFTAAIKTTLGTNALPKHSNVVIDGGNVVDNHIDKAIVTERVFADNKGKHRDDIRQQIKNALGYDYLAVIPDDGSRTGHSDGVVSFIDDNVVALSNHLSWSSRKEKEICVREIMQELGPDIEIVLLNSEFHENSRWREFESAAGLHVNICATNKFLYVPVFGQDPDNKGQSQELDDKVLKQITQYSKKKVVPVEIDSKISRMGGNTRCLSWQLVGPMADAMVRKARLTAVKFDSKFKEAKEPRDD